jgi:hypothetical protein
MAVSVGYVQRRVTFTSLRFNIRSFTTRVLAEDTSSCAVAIVGAQQLDNNSQMPLIAGTV